MAGVSGGLLAAETCRAGALGSIGAGHHNSEPEAKCLEEEVERFRKETASTTAPSPPLVVGFICHSTFASDDGWRLTEEFLSRHKPAAVQFFAPSVVKRESGDKSSTTNNIDLAKRYGCTVITQVGTEADAREALEAGTDCIVAQGTEAGGHGCRSAFGSGTLSIASRLVSIVRSDEKWNNIPVLAAGGIVDGRGLAAALALGCDGAVFGTRLWASKEARGREDCKQRLADQDIGPDQVTRNEVFDLLQNSISSNPWPKPYDSSGIIRNEMINEWEGKLSEAKAQLSKDDSRIIQDFKAANRGDAVEAFIHSGKGVGDISSIDGAYDIIRRVDEEARIIIQHDLRKLLE
eukprot:CAMPEP_0181039696 /NCGR_PEP_ID=MMETSP1070-20121207/10626_1 /TAXON_ID=265543 /ORGANISM="Minutocellus polymorphus, Strain NH13" /LENGTH=348 /DNA_ID=CAMNT_0023117603 /DNA_START=124 /DNA_END=1170 /DNA_ORIENTATION=-